MSDKKTEESRHFDKQLLEATRESALGALAEAGARASDLIDAWVKAGNADAVTTAAESASGALRKAARRGLNVLGARGIKAGAAPHVALLAPQDRERTTEAWLVAPDAGGTALFVIATRSPTTRAESGFFYVHEEVGVHTAHVGSLSGSGLKDALKRASEAGAEPVRVPVDYARKRVQEARDEQKKRGIPEPLGMTSAKALLEPVPAEALPHPLDGEGLEIADEDAKELAKASERLHSLREFRNWLPDRAAVEEMMNDLGERLPKGAEPSPEAIQQILRDAVNAATDRFFGPERRAVLVRRLRDSALSVLATQGEERALELVATTKRIEQAGLITDPPSEVPFLRAFFDKALATLAHQGGGRLQVPLRQPAPEAPAPAPELGASG